MSTPRIKDFSVLDTIASSELFLEKRMDYDMGGNLIYVGYSQEPNAATTGLTWYIVKLTYSGSNVTRYQLPNTGIGFKYAWDSRTTYFA